MNRYKVTATVTADVNACNTEDATDIVSDAVRRADDVRESTFQLVSIEEVPYAIPPGAERWSTAARRQRFDDREDGEGRERRQAVLLDGSWWWTNGHVALRCDGPIPPEPEWEHVQRDARALLIDAERKETTWGVEVKEINAWRKAVTGYRSFANPDVAVQRKYHDLVTDSVPDCTWHIAGPRDPILVRDREGKPVAVVMPYRGEALEPMPPPSRGTEP